MLRLLFASVGISACASLPVGGTSPEREICYVRAESAAYARAEEAAAKACPGVAFLDCSERDAILAALDAELQKGQEACK